MYNLDTNGRSVSEIHLHLILVIKYRRKVLTDGMLERLKEMFEAIAPKYHVTLEEMNHDRDHVHILFRCEPQTEIAKFINVYKSATSRRLKKEFPEIREKLWKEAFWSKSYCLLSAGGAPLEVIEQYIQSQGETE